MKIAVHHTPNDHRASYAWRWIEELNKCGVEVLVLDFRAPDTMERVCGCDGAMWHFWHHADDKRAAREILNAVEFGLDIPVFPNFSTRWHFDEKIAQHYLLEAQGYPRVPSWVFWKREDAVDFITSCTYPIVFKLSVGAGSSNVLKLDSEHEARRIVNAAFGRKGFSPVGVSDRYTKGLKAGLRRLQRVRVSSAIRLKGLLGFDVPRLTEHYQVEKNYVYFQEFVPDNTHDIRITVIGDRALGIFRWNRPDDFRASGGGRLEFDPAVIPIDAVRIAHQISRANGFQAMCYDFLRGANGEMLVNELNYGTISGPHFKCPGYWDSDLNWHDGPVWLEQAHVEDFLTSIAARKEMQSP